MYSSDLSVKKPITREKYKELKKYKGPKHFSVLPFLTSCDIQRKISHVGKEKVFENQRLAVRNICGLSRRQQRSNPLGDANRHLKAHHIPPKLRFCGAPFVL